jgi:hypothetical protein
MNKKINTTLHLLLIIALISSMGIVNACPPFFIESHDVIVKQGATATVKADVYTCNDLNSTKTFLPDIVLCFIITNQHGNVLAAQVTQTGIFHSYSPAICKIDTSRMLKGEYKLTIIYNKARNGQYYRVTYKFNII